MSSSVEGVIGFDKNISNSKSTADDSSLDERVILMLLKCIGLSIL